MTLPTITELRARDDHELETDEVSVEELAEFSKAGTCNGFAFDYLEAHQDNDVVVKDALIEGGDVAHCYVYDATRDVTIDVTMGQFNVGPDIGVWEGERHPYQVDGEEVREWTSRDEFENRYANETHTDFIC